MDVTALREPELVRLGREVHINVLLAAGRAHDAVDEICARGGVTHAQYVALWSLCLSERATDGLTIGELGNELLNRSADTTRLVDRMVKAGLVERLDHPTDRRSVLVRATADGRRAFDTVTPLLQAYHADQWSALTIDELHTLDRLLDKALRDRAAAGPLGRT